MRCCSILGGESLRTIRLYPPCLRYVIEEVGERYFEHIDMSTKSSMLDSWGDLVLSVKVEHFDNSWVNM